MKIHALGYVGFESPRHEDWLAFGPEVLGLQTGERGADGTVHLRMDDRHRRLSVHPGEEDRLAYVGWELAGKAAFTDAVTELEARGYAPRLGSAEDCAERQVQGLARFEDPFGFPHEIFYAPVFTVGSFPAVQAGGRPLRRRHRRGGARRVRRPRDHARTGDLHHRRGRVRAGSVRASARRAGR